MDGRLVCVKEYDWNPAASLVAEGITGPIVLLVQLMACCAAGMTPALQAALDKDASDEEMTRAVAQSASVPLDVLAAATPAERGFLQGARALYYEEQAALLQAAVARTLTGGGRHGE